MINYGFRRSVENGVQLEELNVEIVLGEGGVARYSQAKYGKIEFLGLKKSGVVGNKVVGVERDGMAVSIEFKKVKDLDDLIADLFKVRELMVK